MTADCPECAQRGHIYQLGCSRCMARMLSRYPKRELQAFATAYKAKHPHEWAAIEPMILEEHELG